MMTSKTDSELVNEFQNCNIEGFNELVRRYQEKVYWIARRVVDKHEDADDVVQDVFIRVYRSLPKFRSESGFYTWVYRIAMNVSLNTLRARRIKDFLPYEDSIDQQMDAAGHADEHVLREEYQQILKRAIERLPAKQKLSFTMRYYDEMPYEEMAKVLNKSVGGLKANYFHALKKIQEYVRKEINA